MITEEQKYIASFFEIIGLSFMTPFGKFMLNIRDELHNITFDDILYFAFSIVLVYLGIIFVLKGLEHVEARGKRWD